MLIKTSAENVKSTVAILAIFAAVIGSILSFGSTWKNIPQDVKNNAKQIEQVKRDFWFALEALKKERSEDREILIRIDERVKRLDQIAAGLKK